MVVELDVALGDPEDSDVNTIVFAGVDVLVPVALDLDDDPLQDDEVHLRSADGTVDRVLLASSPDATLASDGEHLLYRFRDVSPGLYEVHVRLAEGVLTRVLAELLVTRERAFVGDRALGAEHVPPAASPEPTAAPEASDPEPTTSVESPWHEFAGDDTE